jgi:hypothetical protein
VGVLTAHVASPPIAPARKVLLRLEPVVEELGEEEEELGGK